MQIERYVELRVPMDLAELLDEIAQPSPASVRSTPLEIIETSTAVAVTTISLLQGPPALAYWKAIIQRWLAERRAAGVPVPSLTMTGPDGSRATVPIHEHTDIAELATVLHKTLFDRPKPRPDLDDDIGL